MSAPRGTAPSRSASCGRARSAPARARRTRARSRGRPGTGTLPASHVGASGTRPRARRAASPRSAPGGRGGEARRPPARPACRAALRPGAWDGGRAGTACASGTGGRAGRSAYRSSAQAGSLRRRGPAASPTARARPPHRSGGRAEESEAIDHAPVLRGGEDVHVAVVVARILPVAALAAQLHRNRVRAEPPAGDAEQPAAKRLADDDRVGHERRPLRLEPEDEQSLEPIGVSAPAAARTSGVPLHALEAKRTVDRRADQAVGG